MSWGPVDAFVELVVCYAGTILDVRHVPERTRAGKPGSFGVGEDPRADLVLSTQALPPGHGEYFELVRAREYEPGFEFVFHPSMRGRLVREGERTSFEELAASGAASAGGEYYSHLLRPGARVIVQLGEGPLSIHMRCVLGLRPQLSPRPLDGPWWTSVAGSAALVLTFLVLMFALPPERQIFLEPIDAERFLLHPPVAHTELELDEVEPPERAPDPGDPSKSRAQAAPAPGQIHIDRDLQPRPDRAPPRPERSLPRVRHTPPSNAGVLAFTGPYMERFAGMYRGAYRPDVDDRELWAQMTGGPPPGFSVGGIGLVTLDPQRGGLAEEAIGLGETALIGHGHGRYHSPVYGRGSIAHHFGNRQRSHHVRLTGMRSLGLEETGIARRIVRAHINELESCYRRHEHRSIPAGAVVVTFLVDADGLVTRAYIKRSDLDVPEFERCLKAAVQRWKFAKPHWGKAHFEQSMVISP